MGRASTMFPAGGKTRTLLDLDHVHGRRTAQLMAAGRPHLALRLRGAIDRDFFRRGRRPIEQLLRRTPATLALHLEEMCDSARLEVKRLLAHLGRCGDRIAVRAPERWQHFLAVDSTVLELSFEPG
jgi:hypothetical protein